MSIEVFFDGACEPNPNGQMAYGAVIYKDNSIVKEISQLYNKPNGTNNIAEYCGVIASLKFLIHAAYQEYYIKVFGDSKLVICQMKDEWKINGGAYEPYARKAILLRANFSDISFEWISKHQNTEADRLSRRFL